MYNILYSNAQLDVIQDNIDMIEGKANQVVDKVLYPTLEMKNNIFKLILQFISDTPSIMFSDYMNTLSMTDTKNLSKALKQERWMDTSTPLAYTHDPQTVLVKMVDYLKSTIVPHNPDQSAVTMTNGGEQSIQSSASTMLAPTAPEISAGELHKLGTFVIQVDIIRYLYIKYVPQNIYDSLRCTHDGIEFIHPAIRTIDNLMVVTDPLRQVNQYKEAVEHLQNASWNHTNLHPVSLNKAQSSPRPQPHSMSLINAIMDCVVDKKMILVGELCLNLYQKYVHFRTNKPPLKTYMQVSCIQAVTNDFENDLLYIIKSLQDLISIDDLSINHHEPFLTYRGKNVLICYKKSPLVRLYHHNGQCVPFHELPSNVQQGGSKANNTQKSVSKTSTTTILVATWNVMLLHLYIDWMESFQGKDITVPYTMIVKLLELRRTFHHDTNTTPLDDTLFQEFKFECKGKTMPFRQAESMRRQARFKARKMVSWKYQPNSGVKTLELPKMSGSKCLADD